MTARHRASRASRPRRPAAAFGSGAVALLLFVAALLVGALPARADTAATLLRLAQLTPDLPDVEFVVSSVADSRKSVVATTLHFGEVSAYQPVEPGDYVVTMRPAGSTAPPSVSRTLSVEPGTTHTVASVRHTKTPADLQVFTDDLTPPPADRARLRVINAAPPAPELDVKDGNGQPVALGLPNGQASPYREVAPGAMQWSVGPPSGTVASVSGSVAPNQVVSLVLTSSGGAPQAKVVVDAAGPAAVPPGPVHAGYGGTAGPAPGATVASGVLAALAALAVAASLRLKRLR